MGQEARFQTTEAARAILPSRGLSLPVLAANADVRELASAVTVLLSALGQHYRDLRIFPGNYSYSVHVIWLTN